MGPHLTSKSEIGGTDSAALRTSWTCLWLCGSCVTSCTSFFRGSDPAVYEAPETSITDSSPYISVACQSLYVTWLNVALEEICFDANSRPDTNSHSSALQYHRIEVAVTGQQQQLIVRTKLTTFSLNFELVFSEFNAFVSTQYVL